MDLEKELEEEKTKVLAAAAATAASKPASRATKKQAQKRRKRFIKICFKQITGSPTDIVDKILQSNKAYLYIR